MKFKNIAKVIVSIELGQYHPEMDGQVVQVWLNPTNELVAQRMRLQQDAFQLIVEQSKLEKNNAKKLAAWAKRSESTQRGLFAWHAAIWSAGDDPETHWTAQEVEKANQQSPDFYRWLVERTSALFEERRDAQKKALKTA